MRGNHNLQFKQRVLYLIWDVTAEHHNRSWHICQGCYWFCGNVVIYCILLDSKHFIPAKNLTVSSCFLFPFNEKNNLNVWWMTVSNYISYTHVWFLRGRLSLFMCSLTHTTPQQPTQIKHIVSEPPCCEIAFVFHFCSSVCLERTVLLNNQEYHLMAVIQCIKQLHETLLRK